MLGLHHELLPRGQEKSYLSPRGTQGLVVSVVFTSLATCFVGARLYTRISLMKRMESNDWMILIALIFSFVFMAFYMIEAVNGMGMHGADIPPPIMTKQMKAFWITVPFYNAALLCAKASILMQYFRVFPTKAMRVTCWVLIMILAIYGSWAVLSAFLNCIPVAKFWDDSVPGYCLSKTALWFSNASMHISTDLAILITPIPALCSLDLPKRQRIALIAIFALGGFVCVTSVCRLTSLKSIADSKDPTYDNVGAASWSAIECNTGIICACLPTLRPLISRFLPHVLSTLSGGIRSYGDAPLSQGRAPTYWNGFGTGSTIGAPGDDVEYSALTLDSERAEALVRANGFVMHGRGLSRDGKGSKEATVTTESKPNSSSSSPPTPPK